MLVAHFAREFERAARAAPRGAEVQLVWVCDFAGFGLRDAIDPRAAVQLIYLFQARSQHTVLDPCAIKSSSGILAKFRCWKSKAQPWQVRSP
jgi:hypothetical protein